MKLQKKATRKGNPMTLMGTGEVANLGFLIEVKGSTPSFYKDAQEQEVFSKQQIRANCGNLQKLIEKSADWSPAVSATGASSLQGLGIPLPLKPVVGMAKSCLEQGVEVREGGSSPLTLPVPGRSTTSVSVRELTKTLLKRKLVRVI